jgi:hypothetical protein
MYDVSPFDVNLFLDDDTLVFHDLDFGFQQANKHGICVCIAPRPCLFYDWKIRAKNDSISLDLIQYNSGVIFFKKERRTKKVFDRWRLMVTEMKASWDQHLFSYAFYCEHYNPFVLPPNWNFRPQKGAIPLNGPIRILHCRQEEIKDRNKLIVAIKKHNNAAKRGNQWGFSFKWDHIQVKHPTIM